MNAFAVLIAIAAWGTWLVPLGGVVRWLLFMLFLALGALLALFGGFVWWWDSSMRPTAADPTPMICGLLTLASRVGTLLRAVLENEGGAAWPETRPPRRR